MKFHMLSPIDHMFTRCGRSIEYAPHAGFDYGSSRTTCKTCLLLYAKDLSGGDDQ